MNRDDDGYAERVAFYDTVYEQPERALDLAWLRRWLPQQYFGRRVLELACGSGYWTQYLAPAARAYLALDVSPGALALAGQRPGVGSPACGFPICRASGARWRWRRCTAVWRPARR
ncbi:class I SAM-dependent methyltransferase [Chromobacterium piscinae]|uniref:class I SAM-dependent methyltransferase n=1 Tax=Chromobacterium piscinae TaxID=686831 RepID=UPI003260A1AA